MKDNSVKSVFNIREKRAFGTVDNMMQNKPSKYAGLSNVYDDIVFVTFAQIQACTNGQAFLS